MLLVSTILENAARVAPDAVAATLDDDALTFGEIEARGNRIAHALLAPRDRPRRPGALVGRHVARGRPRVRGAGQDRRGVRTAERAGVARGGGAGRRVRPRPRCCSRRRLPRAGAELARQRGRAVRRRVSTRDAFPATAPAADVHEDDPHVIFFTSGSTGRPKGVVLSHRTNWLRTFVGATTQPGRRRHGVHVPAVPHGGLDDRARRVAGAGAPSTSCASPDAATLLATAARHRAARLYCIPAVWARILEHGVDGYDLSSLVEADTGTSATPPELLARDQGRAPPHRDPGLLRIDRGGPVARARRRRPLPQAGQRRCRAARRGGAARRARRGLRAQPVPHGRLLRRSRRDRARRSSTAGTTPATSARSTTRATCRSSAGRAT